MLRLKPISYNYNDDNPLGIANGGDHIGFVAQEVEKVIPEAISYTEDGYLMIDNDPIIWTMLNAIKEVNGLCEMSQKQKKSLEKQVDNNEKKLELHQREIATLKAENKKLREEIQSIKKALVKLNLE